MKESSEARCPAVVRCAVVAAWLNLAAAVILTVSFTVRHQLLAVALPTLATQSLPTLGMSLATT
jgi:hypothetical protein